MRVVLDTNVVVSALLWGGTPYRLMQAATDGLITLYTSPALLDELRGVLIREHLRSRLDRQNASIEQAMAFYGALTIGVSPSAVQRVVEADPDDDHVIAACVAAETDLLVSGDRHLLKLGRHQKIRIVTPTEAMAIVTR